MVGGCFLFCDVEDEVCVCGGEVGCGFFDLRGCVE